jgi:hypothetical protein
MLALVGTVMSRSPSGNVLLRYGDGVLGTHKLQVAAAVSGAAEAQAMVRASTLAGRGYSDA